MRREKTRQLNNCTQLLLYFIEMNALIKQKLLLVAINKKARGRVPSKPTDLHQF